MGFDWRSVKVSIRDREVVEKVTSVQVRDYAERLGYSHIEDWRYSQVWRVGGNRKTELLIPIGSVEIADFAEVQAGNIVNLALHTGLSELAVLEDLLNESKGDQRCES